MTKENLKRYLKQSPEMRKDIPKLYTTATKFLINKIIELFGVPGAIGILIEGNFRINEIIYFGFKLNDINSVIENLKQEHETEIKTDNEVFEIPTLSV